VVGLESYEEEEYSTSTRWYELLKDTREEINLPNNLYNFGLLQVSSIV
jgi:hypothetical protein